MNDCNLDFASSPDFFEAKYQKTGDPWNFSRDPYELGRYEAIIEAICHKRYRKAFEPGCSIGVLTERLARYCDTVHAEDFSASAAAQAQARCAHLPHVKVRCAALKPELPSDDVDLLVLSEIGYYFEAMEWQRISSALVDLLLPGGTVLVAHWLGYSKDHRISGDMVHKILLSHPKLEAQQTEQSQSLRLDRLVRR